MPEEWQAELAEWLLAGMPLHKAKELLFKQFQVTTSLGALSNFWNDVVSPNIRLRRQQAVKTADECAAEAAKHPGQFDAAALDLLREKAFLIAADPQAAGREVKAIFGLILKARDQELKGKDIDIKMRRLELLERNAAVAKEKLTAVAGKGGLTPEAIAEIESAAKLL